MVMSTREYTIDTAGEKIVVWKENNNGVQVNNFNYMHIGNLFGRNFVDKSVNFFNVINIMRLPHPTNG